MMTTRAAFAAAAPRMFATRRLPRSFSTASPAPLASLLNSFHDADRSHNSGHAANSYKATITDEWMQGQTTYGGLSAALCLEGALRTMDAAYPAEDGGGGDRPPPPPLRSANIAFIGAAGGDVHIGTSVLRQSPKSAFVGSELSAGSGGDGAGAATTCLFVFGRPRLHSKIDARLVAPPPAGLPPPEACPSLFAGMPPPGEGWFPPVFAQHFEARRAAGAPPAAGSDAADLWIWVRHIGADALGGVAGVRHETALLALADMLPPASCALFHEPAPVSSVTWHVNVLDGAPRAHGGGWWLLRTSAEHARHGYSSQHMELWGESRDGPAVVGRQCVAIYA